MFEEQAAFQSEPNWIKRISLMKTTTKITYVVSVLYILNISFLAMSQCIRIPMNPGATKKEIEQTYKIRINETHFPQQAIDGYRQVLKKYPHNRIARYRLVVLLTNRGMIDEAKEHLLYLDKEAPHFNGTHIARLQFYRITGQIQKELDSINKAEKDILEGIELELSLNVLKERKALLHRDYKTAKSLIGTKIPNANKIGLSTILTIVKYARLEEYFGNYPQAIIELDKIRSIYKNNPNLPNREIMNVYILFHRFLWILANDSSDVPEDDIMELKYALFPELALHFNKANATNDTRDNGSHAENIRMSSEDISRFALIFYLMSKVKLCNLNYGDDLPRLKMCHLRLFSVEDPLCHIATIITNNDSAAVQKEAKRISSILKKAPGLEWANWAGLFLAVSDEDAFNMLASRLQKGSMQSLYLRIHTLLKNGEEGDRDHEIDNNP